LRHKNSDLISEEDMRALIRAEADIAGNVNQLCSNLRMKSAAPVYLALQKNRQISDGVSLPFGYVSERMFRRIGHASRA
jgi:hypothetical protein